MTDPDFRAALKQFADAIDGWEMEPAEDDPLVNAMESQPDVLPPPMNDRTTQSDPWGHGIDVKRLADRLDELADYVTQGADCVRRNFVMQFPAEPYHDADLVISTAACLLRDGLVTPPSPAQPPAQPVNRRLRACFK